ncbi:SRPBCC domain-containing protein [Polluticoccus soli]|uniref:SRPBCC domain-containing protein n=1 Tax=Polluticoccus soli TaxID=3034150 RepID=UPI0023E0D8A8|nr:SRPBCC domain-containing protein [Flavipsychrobacter sp. JY13-12]
MSKDTIYDWSRFILKINIKAPVDAVYYAWTRADELEKWFLRRALFHNPVKKDLSNIQQFHAEDTYEWWWHGRDNTVVEKGKVLYANGVDKIQFSFAGGAHVTVQIGTFMDETIVMLTQDKIPTTDIGKVKYHMDCKCGWTFYLANLKSYLEGGVDLRNKNVEHANMVNS